MTRKLVNRVQIIKDRIVIVGVLLLVIELLRLLKYVS